MSNQNTPNDLVKYIDLFEEDSEVQNEIKKELSDLNKLNLATKAEYSNNLVIDRKKAQAAVKELFLTVGEQQQEIDILEDSNKKLQSANKYYKNKLDENNIVYTKGLEDLSKNNKMLLVKNTEEDKLKLAFRVLEKRAKRNQNT